MSVPERIQRKRTRGWRMPPGAIYVGRPSRFGNPFGIERVDCSHSLITPMCWLVADGNGIHSAHLNTKRRAAEDAVELYRTHAGPMGRYEIDDDDLAVLRGHDLACWCPLEDEHGNRVPCHADVLLEWSNR